MILWLDNAYLVPPPSCTRPPALMHIAATARQVRPRKGFSNWVLIGVKNTCLCHNFPSEAIAATSYESLLSRLLLNRQQHQTFRQMTPEMRDRNINNVGTWWPHSEEIYECLCLLLRDESMPMLLAMRKKTERLSPIRHPSLKRALNGKLLP